MLPKPIISAAHQTPSRPTAETDRRRHKEEGGDDDDDDTDTARGVFEFALNVSYCSSFKKSVCKCGIRVCCLQGDTFDRERFRQSDAGTLQNLLPPSDGGPRGEVVGGGGGRVWISRGLGTVDSF